jgi:hypothetical protein
LYCIKAGSIRNWNHLQGIDKTMKEVVIPRGIKLSVAILLETGHVEERLNERAEQWTINHFDCGAILLDRASQ